MSEYFYVFAILLKCIKIAGPRQTNIYVAVDAYTYQCYILNYRWQI